MLHIEGQAGTARQIEVQLRAIDLQENELAVLNITHIAAGVITGGYALVLAHPNKFQDSLLFSLKGGTMQPQNHETNDDTLRKIVLDHFHQARLTFLIVRALQRHLPFTSIEQTKRVVKDLKIDGHSLSDEIIERFSNEQLLPVRDNNDLVRKVAGLLNIAVQLEREGAATSSAAGEAGPSIFGSTPATGEQS